MRDRKLEVTREEGEVPLKVLQAFQHGVVEWQASQSSFVTDIFTRTRPVGGRSPRLKFLSDLPLSSMCQKLRTLARGWKAANMHLSSSCICTAVVEWTNLDQSSLHNVGLTSGGQA